MDAYVKGAAALDAPIVAPGDVIGGKYRIEAVLGRGGMSVVYRATHLELDQLVAIKLLSPAALVMPGYVARLRREARAASRIRSQHVVRVFDVGELPSQGIPYLVMEHLVGADLAAVLARRGTLPVRLAVECLLQACEALAEAHAIGIIHRDLKPANLFLTEGVDGSPCVKLLDFGISRMTGRSGLSPLTDPGIVLGTPNYMAPEQMEASDGIDARSDIWALGAILFELLVGRPPYAGETLTQIFVKIMRSKTPRPSASRPDLDRGLDEIVERCLAVDPERRFASVAALGWALSALAIPDATHARDSAARIARVFDRSSCESGLDVIASAQGSEETREDDVPRSFSRKLAAAASTALVLGAAAGFVGMTQSGVAVEDPRGRGITPSATMLAMPEARRAKTTTDAGVAAVLPAAATIDDPRRPESD